VKARGYRKPNRSELEYFQTFGVIKPVVIAATADPAIFEILAQEESWFAAQSLKVFEIETVEVFPKSVQERMQLSNSELSDDPISEAEKYRDWLEANPMETKSDLARLEGVDRTLVVHKIRLLSLEPEIRDLVRIRKLSLTHALQLLKIRPSPLRLILAEKSIAQGWGVAKLKKVIAAEIPVSRQRGEQGESLKSDNRRERRMSNNTKPPTKDPNILALEKHMTGLIGSEVSINHESGQLTIDYQKNLDVLQGVLMKMGYRKSR